MRPGDTPPWELRSAGGLRAVVPDGGAPASLGTGDLELVQHAASAFEPGLLQLWLRDRAAGTAWPLLGPGSRSRVHVEGASEGDTDGDAEGHTLVVAGDSGEDGPLRWRVTLALSPTRTAWTWHVEVRNDGGRREVDLVHTHDVALAAPGALRVNELYVSQYLDVSPVPTPTGTALAVRQNQPQQGRHPWCVLTADVPVVAWATDALDVHGWSARHDGAPAPPGDLPSRRRQHEHTLAALQTERRTLATGESLHASFVGLLLADHPGATTDDDAAYAAEALALAVRPGRSVADASTTDLSGTDPAGRPAPTGAYDRGRSLRSRSLTEAELRERWPEPWRVVERADDGDLWSFFTAEDEHVVTAAKELAVLRPHGTILRTGDTAAPDPSSLAVTAWAAGSPLSYLTLGHASTGRVLTTVRGYLGLHRAYGLRLLVEVDGAWRLLDLPSAFAMAPDGARWVHVLDGSDGTDATAGGRKGGESSTVEVRTVAPAGEHRVRLDVRLTGPARRVLVALHVATPEEPLPASPDDVRVAATAEGVEVRVGGPDAGRTLHVRSSVPVETGDDGPLFDDGASRVPGVVTLATGTTDAVELDLQVTGWRRSDPESSRASADRRDPDPRSAARPGRWWPDVAGLRLGGDLPEVEPLAVSLPWLVRDALVHFLSPRGLEQYTGGAWGTRDVTQGPLELLLALDRLDDARALLLTVFAAQNPDGTWPQAFGFLPGDEGFRHEPPHGDVVHWPVLALGRYLLASGDASVLDADVPWWSAGSSGSSATVRQHVARALAHAREHVLPGTHLVAYGHGDWNDSLQPADPSMARTMSSAWTVTLHHQGLRTLADGLEAAGAGADGEGDPLAAHDLRVEAAAVAADLERFLMVDGELAGYVQLTPPDASGDVAVHRLLVHPRDTETGLRHGSLQVIHALGEDLLDPDQAAHHVALVREHLMGVDGVRLFDRPPTYRGGVMEHFQRAETATFVGREIGLMYVHAHLRWCEAMARWGDPDALWLGLRQVLAPAVEEVVAPARPRQANTYASSSDAACLDRADFAERYAQVVAGEVPLEAGWRIYSSGPGVLLRVISQSLLGVRRRGDRVEVDPVLPSHLDGLTAQVPLDGGVLRVRYHVGARGHGPTSLRLAGAELTTDRTTNPYREGGVVVALADLAEALAPGGPELEVHLP